MWIICRTTNKKKKVRGRPPTTRRAQRGSRSGCHTPRARADEGRHTKRHKLRAFPAAPAQGPYPKEPARSKHRQKAEKRKGKSEEANNDSSCSEVRKRRSTSGRDPPKKKILRRNKYVPTKNGAPITIQFQVIRRLNSPSMRSMAMQRGLAEEPRAFANAGRGNA